MDMSERGEGIELWRFHCLTLRETIKTWLSVLGSVKDSHTGATSKTVRTAESRGIALLPRYPPSPALPKNFGFHCLTLRETIKIDTLLVDCSHPPLQTINTPNLFATRALGIYTYRHSNLFLCNSAIEFLTRHLATPHFSLSHAA